MDRDTEILAYLLTHFDAFTRQCDKCPVCFIWNKKVPLLNIPAVSCVVQQELRMCKCSREEKTFIMSWPAEPKSVPEPYYIECCAQLLGLYIIAI